MRWRSRWSVCDRSHWSAVPLLLMAGVFWLRHLPVGTNQRSGDNVVEVHLIAQQDATVPPQEAAQPVRASLKQETEPLVRRRSWRSRAAIILTRSVPPERLA
jgi:hypothetical protein